MAAEDSASLDSSPVVSTAGVGRRTVAATFELDARRIMAYAAGVDDPNPAYFDDARPAGLIAHPGLVFSLQWQTRHQPGRPLDPRVARLGVHAGVDVRFARALRWGDVISAQGEVIAVRQLRAGVLEVVRVTLTDAQGETVVELDSSGIVRGARTDGPDRERAAPPPLPEPSGSGAAPKWCAEVPIALHTAHVYTECARIWNPIHTERRVALAAGLPDAILHGTATLAIALRELVNRSLDGDPTPIARCAAQFRSMVLPGRPIVVRCLEERRAVDGSRLIFFDVHNDEGKPAVRDGVLVARTG